ncbi:MAG: lysophospholipid acyltransferase family protein [Bacteroidia bacterium]
MIILNYLLYYGIILPLSWLPMRVLYVLSDVCYYIIYKGFKYRVPVVQSNMKRALPHLSLQELQATQDEFYSHLFDMIVESVKNFSMSKAELQKRCKPTNPEVFQTLANEGKSLLGITGHYGNWEWAATSFGMYSTHKPFGIFIPLKNKFWNQKVIQSRSRFGVGLLAPVDVPIAYEQNKNEVMSCGFIMDQSPGTKTKAYWLTFMGQPTAVAFGVERYANLHNHSAVQAVVRKVKRGYYEVTFYKLTDDPNSLPYGVLTQLHSRLNEYFILQQPAYWLWSHKRWKLLPDADTVINTDTELTTQLFTKLVAEIENK